jgi:hypothetical protein
LPPDRPTSTNSREAPEVNKELWDGEFWTDVITLPQSTEEETKPLLKDILRNESEKTMQTNSSCLNFDQNNLDQDALRSLAQGYSRVP